MLVEIKLPPVLEPIKTHVRKHKIAYSFGIGISIAGITGIIMRGRYAGFLRSPDTASSNVFIRPLSFLSKQNVVTVIEREGRGHPGYIVLCKETGQIFVSQNKAALSAGTSAQNMSSHLNGHFPDIYGLHFERLSLPT